VQAARALLHGGARLQRELLRHGGQQKLAPLLGGAALLSLAGGHIPAFHAGAVDHRAHQGLRAGEAVGHALCRHAAVALAVVHHVFDQTQAEQQQQGDGRQRGQFGKQGIFQGLLHGECEGSVVAPGEATMKFVRRA
jgi:hypothetical protein